MSYPYSGQMPVWGRTGKCNAYKCYMRLVWLIQPLTPCPGMDLLLVRAWVLLCGFLFPLVTQVVSRKADEEGGLQRGRKLTIAASVIT